MHRQKLLLHTCCAPCFAYVHSKLVDMFEVTSYFYNPNIAPKDEFLRRLRELSDYSLRVPFSLLVEQGDPRGWVSEVKKYRFQGERSERCNTCIRLRLDRTFRKAVELRSDAVGTVLTISPHKDAEAINEIGRVLGEKYGIEFLQADYKKGNGFRNSVLLSKKNSFYRQDYCGCIYSKLERRRDSLWYRNTKKLRSSANPGQ